MIRAWVQYVLINRAKKLLSNILKSNASDKLNQFSSNYFFHKFHSYESNLESTRKKSRSFLVVISASLENVLENKLVVLRWFSGFLVFVLASWCIGYRSKRVYIKINRAAKWDRVAPLFINSIKFDDYSSTFISFWQDHFHKIGFIFILITICVMIFWFY